MCLEVRAKLEKINSLCYLEVHVVCVRVRKAYHNAKWQAEHVC